MTFTPSRPCKKSGCGALVGVGEGTYCPAHRTAARVEVAVRDRHRGSAAARGYDASWQRARFAFLSQYPLCPGVLFPTELWTRELAQQFHALREECREHGHILIFNPVASARGLALSSPLSALAAWLDEQRIYRVEPWDVSKPAVVVDHIIPHKGDYELMWAPWNWQAITKRAHDRKTATEQVRGSQEESHVL